MEKTLKISKKFKAIQLKIIYMLIQHTKMLIKNNIKIKDYTLKLPFYFFNFSIKEEELKELREITIKIKENKSNWKYFSILSYLEKKEDFYYFKFTSYIINLIKENKIKNFLDEIAIKSLNSKYSEYIYIFYLKEKNILKLSIEKLRNITNTENSYKRIRDLKDNVLNIACNEISEKTDIEISYKTEKIGKRIAFINFEINNKYYLDEDLDNIKEEVDLLKEIEKVFLIKQEDNLLSKK